MNHSFLIIYAICVWMMLYLFFQSNSRRDLRKWSGRLASAFIATAFSIGVLVISYMIWLTFNH